MARRVTAAAAILVLMTTAGCLDEDIAVEPEASPQTVASAIRNGTSTPANITLTAGQTLSIGWLHQRGYPSDEFCSGTLIAPRHVVTAKHCTQGWSASYLSFGVGDRTNNHADTFSVVQVFEHPGRDVAVMVLGRDATASGLVPIEYSRTGVVRSDLGSPLDAAGYGNTRGSNPDGRWFAEVEFESFDEQLIYVNGNGLQGICEGDSGGPLMRMEDGQPVVMAVEWGGDTSCLGQDYLSRLDVLQDWIDPILNGETPPDPCEGLDFRGRCNGNTAEWCQNGQPRQRTCEGEFECGYVNDNLGYACTSCGDVDFLGRCDGAVAEYCDREGKLTQFDCAAQGDSCGFVDGDTGYYCTDAPATCSPTDNTCDGSTAVRCEDGELTQESCGDGCELDSSGAPFCAIVMTPEQPTQPTLPEAETPDLEGDKPVFADVSSKSRSGERDGCSVSPASRPAGVPAGGLLLLGCLLFSRRRAARRS